MSGVSRCRTMVDGAGGVEGAGGNSRSEWDGGLKVVGTILDGAQHADAKGTWCGTWVSWAVDGSQAWDRGWCVSQSQWDFKGERGSIRSKHGMRWMWVVLVLQCTVCIGGSGGNQGMSPDAHPTITRLAVQSKTEVVRQT